MKRFVIYTVGFFAPIIALVIAQNLWARATHFETRTAGGWLYITSRTTGQVTGCIRDRCLVLRDDGNLPKVAGTNGTFDDLPPSDSR
jgi:hypothetical protein